LAWQFKPGSFFELEFAFGAICGILCVSGGNQLENLLSAGFSSLICWEFSRAAQLQWECRTTLKTCFMLGATRGKLLQFSILLLFAVFTSLDWNLV
jgi:hypothetical protein